MKNVPPRSLKEFRSQLPVRFSELAVYSGCGERHHRRYVHLSGSQGLSSLEAEAGTAIHLAIQHYENNHMAGYGPMLPSTLYDVARNVLSGVARDLHLHTQHPTHDLDWWLKTGIPSHLRNYLRWRGDRKRVLVSEETIVTQIDGIPYQFTIDEAEYLGGTDTWYLYDYKTGKPDVSHGIQLDCYAVAWETAGRGSVSRLALLYTAGDSMTEVVVPRRLSRLTMAQMLEPVWETRTRGAVYPIQGPFNGTCDNCEFTNCPFRNLGDPNRLILRRDREALQQEPARMGA